MTLFLPNIYSYQYHYCRIAAEEKKKKRAILSMWRSLILYSTLCECHKHMQNSANFYRIRGLLRDVGQEETKCDLKMWIDDHSIPLFPVQGSSHEQCTAIKSVAVIVWRWKIEHKGEDLSQYCQVFHMPHRVIKAGKKKKVRKKLDIDSTYNLPVVMLWVSSRQCSRRN